MTTHSPPASRGFTRRGGGASITIIPAEREDSAGFYIALDASVRPHKVKIYFDCLAVVGMTSNFRISGESCATGDKAPRLSECRWQQAA